MKNCQSAAQLTIRLIKNEGKLIPSSENRKLSDVPAKSSVTLKRHYSGQKDDNFIDTLRFKQIISSVILFLFISGWKLLFYFFSACSIFFRLRLILIAKSTNYFQMLYSFISLN